MVVSDSQAALMSVRSVTGSLREGVLERVLGVLRNICSDGRRLVFVWVPGHCGLIGNELADAAAKRASKNDQSDAACLYKSVRALWKRRERVREWQHQRCQEVYGDGVKFDLERDWCREDAVSMARLRSGHSLELLGYRRRIGLTDDGACRMCGDDDETVEHVLDCVAGWRARADFGVTDGLRSLCCRPREALKYWKWWRRTRPR